jgi:hypothetical protein
MLGTNKPINIAYKAMPKLAVKMAGRKSDANAPMAEPAIHED